MILMGSDTGTAITGKSKTQQRQNMCDAVNVVSAEGRTATVVVAGVMARDLTGVFRLWRFGQI